MLRKPLLASRTGLLVTRMGWGAMYAARAQLRMGQTSICLPSASRQVPAIPPCHACAMRTCGLQSPNRAPTQSSAPPQQPPTPICSS